MEIKNREYFEKKVFEKIMKAKDCLIEIRKDKNGRILEVKETKRLNLEDE